MLCMNLFFWTQWHEIIFIHDCLDYFPNSCDLTDILSTSFCRISYPCLTGQPLFFVFWHFWKRMEPEFKAHVSVSISPFILIVLGWQNKPKTIILESVLPFSEWELFKTFSCPVTEGPHHKDGLHFHSFILLLITLVLVQAVTIIYLKDLNY